MKELPVSIEKQKEVIVDYAIAKFMNKGIAFKSKQNDCLSRCWIKYYEKQKQFHLTLRFQGVDYITGAGSDKFDIDLYIPMEDFISAFNEIVIKDFKIDTSSSQSQSKPDGTLKSFL